MAEQQISRRVFTIPNVISFLRLVVLLPVTMWLIGSGRPGWALLSMIALGMTDWLDGFLARQLNQVSELGRQMDPVTDRLSIVLISLALVFSGLLPWQVVVVIAAMDLVCVVGMLAILHSTHLVYVSLVGKLRTFVLLLGLPLLLLADMVHSNGLFVVASWVVWIGTFLHLLAGLGYVRSMFDTRRKLREDS